MLTLSAGDPRIDSPTSDGTLAPTLQTFDIIMIMMIKIVIIMMIMITIMIIVIIIIK